ncbi:ribosomal RNA-processing protein 8-like [Aphidius gifuensis]|uniref:ribosomal RNA-processing protein 8-like n=1 Tax=Aphidius gifuensis TaxID=684658 RepID=UPI001CDC4F55|nr:ribosomal RNA-processing protein 8-like [Aphidius gifuensis]
MSYNVFKLHSDQDVHEIEDDQNPANKTVYFTYIINEVKFYDKAVVEYDLGYDMPKEYVIADFGCGDAKLCEPVEQKVHSLDLVAVNDKVTACDMAHTSLLTISVNVVVFCLSFIGKNLADYLLEAKCVLKQDGILKIADVVSRFENIKEFVKSLDKYGFQNTYQDLSNNLFYFMDFKKIEDVNRRNKNLPQIYLKTCLYKRR